MCDDEQAELARDGTAGSLVGWAALDGDGSERDADGGAVDDGAAAAVAALVRVSIAASTRRVRWRCAARAASTSAASCASTFRSRRKRYAAAASEHADTASEAAGPLLAASGMVVGLFCLFRLMSSARREAVV